MVTVHTLNVVHMLRACCVLVLCMYVHVGCMFYTCCVHGLSMLCACYAHVMHVTMRVLCMSHACCVHVTMSVRCL